MKIKPPRRTICMATEWQWIQFGKTQSHREWKAHKLTRFIIICDRGTFQKCFACVFATARFLSISGKFHFYSILYQNITSHRSICYAVFYHFISICVVFCVFSLSFECSLNCSIIFAVMFSFPLSISCSFLPFVICWIFTVTDIVLLFNLLHFF